MLFEIGGENAGLFYQLACFNLDTKEYEFTIDMEQQSELVEYSWLDDMNIITWESGAMDGQSTIVTFYAEAGQKTDSFTIEEAIQRMSGAAKNGNPARVCILDSFDASSSKVISALGILDFENKQLSRVYSRTDVITSAAMSLDGEKILWTEGDGLFEAKWRTDETAFAVSESASVTGVVPTTFTGEITP